MWRVVERLARLLVVWRARVGRVTRRNRYEQREMSFCNKNRSVGPYYPRTKESRVWIDSLTVSQLLWIVPSLKIVELSLVPIFFFSSSYASQFNSYSNLENSRWQRQSGPKKVCFRGINLLLLNWAQFLVSKVKFWQLILGYAASICYKSVYYMPREARSYEYIFSFAYWDHWLLW